MTTAKKSKPLYLCEEEYFDAKTKGFIVERNRGWEFGEHIDIYGGPADWGLMGTVVEVATVEGVEKCLIEIW